MKQIQLDIFDYVKRINEKEEVYLNGDGEPLPWEELLQDMCE